MPLVADFNIVLTGFMGTGKSAVGQRLATRLGRVFVDMDARIEARAGLSIPEVFAQRGETAFRALERAVCRDVARPQQLVIATGGGTLLDPRNRTRLERCGLVVCLTARADCIAARLRAESHRPLLENAAQSRAERIQELLEKRASLYNALRHQVDTSDLSVDEVVTQVQAIVSRAAPPTASLNADALAAAQRLEIRSPENVYPIWVGEGALRQVGQALRVAELVRTDIGIVTHPPLADRYGAALSAAVAAAGFTPHLFTFPAGERHKGLDTVRALYAACVKANLDRRSTLVALGGGVVTDVTGFLAATYLRGVPYFPVPSTLLSMVDSSVGAKSGVDLPEGKNLVGAFKQPAGVVVDPALLDSLPPAEIRAGMAEVIKHAIVGDAALFALLEAEGLTRRSLVLTRAIQVKIDIVEEDPYEQGRRSVLNLGHTFAHAMEQVSRYRIRHGEAVAIGLAAAARLSVALGRCAPSLAERIERLVRAVGLPARLPEWTPDAQARFDPEALYAAMATDKKRQGSRLRFAVIDDLEAVRIIDNPGDAFVLDAWRYVLS